MIYGTMISNHYSGDCGDDQYRCKTGSNFGVCIRSSFKCDGILHCYGGEDEKDCRKNAIFLRYSIFDLFHLICQKKLKNLEVVRIH